MPLFARSVFLLGLVLISTGCLSPGATRETIATQLFESPSAEGERVLVVVLPGRGDDLQGLADSGIAAAIQKAWPEADVLLAEVGLGYYYEGRMPERLHTEVIAPAKTRGYAGVWLAGASMGGMGTLLYERSRPGELDGLVLLAPYLGDRRLLAEIGEAGLADWTPGPVPPQINRKTFQREVWRHVQGWPDSGRSAAVWLAYGEDDRLAKAIGVLAPALPPDQVLARPGGHAWVVWTPAAAEIFARIRARQPAR
ncbi:alpha/beta fold hydrolase [Arenimonas alkanexedens]